MELDHARALKQDVLLQHYRETFQENIGLRANSLPAQAAQADQLSVGYSRWGPHDYHVELRLRRMGGRAHQVAEALKAKAENEVHIAQIDSLHVPSQKDLIQAALQTSQKAAFSRGKRPLHIGLSIGHSDGGAGTLGAFVESAQGDAILSNCHVLALMGKAKNGDQIYQPGRQDTKVLTGTDSIASLANYTTFSKLGSNYLDGAYALIDHDCSHDGNLVPVGPSAGQKIASIIDYDDLLPNQVVAKVGRTTGYTTGTVKSFAIDDVVINMPSIGNTRFDNLLEIIWDTTESPFTKEGDSGVFVFTAESLSAVGMHFASGVVRIDGRHVGLSYACGLAYLLEIFSLKLIL